jgi:hypothetical protein
MQKNTSKAVATLTRHFFEEALWVLFKNRKYE